MRPCISTNILEICWFCILLVPCCFRVLLFQIVLDGNGLLNLTTYHMFNCSSVWPVGSLCIEHVHCFDSYTTNYFTISLEKVLKTLVHLVQTVWWLWLSAVQKTGQNENKIEKVYYRGPLFWISLGSARCVNLVLSCVPSGHPHANVATSGKRAVMGETTLHVIKATPYQSWMCCLRTSCALNALEWQGQMASTGRWLRTKDWMVWQMRETQKS